MDPNSLDKLGRDLQKRPRKVILFLLISLFLFGASAWLVSYLTEHARQVAEDADVLQSEPAVRVQYYRFQGTPLLYLVTQGKAFSPEDGFSHQPHWVKNEVLRHLSELLALNTSWAEHYKERNKGDLPYDVMQVILTGPSLKTAGIFKFNSQWNEQDQSAEVSELRKQFLGTMSVFRGPNLVQSFEPNFLLRKLQVDPFWTVKLAATRRSRRDEALGLADYSFFALPTTDEIRSYKTPQYLTPALRDPISRELLARYPNQRDIVSLVVRLEHDAYYGTLLIRELKLLAVDIENVGDKPLGLKALRAATLHARDAFTLTHPVELARRFESIDTEDDTIPMEMLLPGEHLFVPLRLDFGYPSEVAPATFFNPEGLMTEDQIPRESDLNRIRGDSVRISILRGAENQGNAEMEVFAIGKGVLESKVNFSRQIQDYYHLGSVVDVKDLVFRVSEGRLVDYPIRQFDPNNLVVSGGFEKGSCPILYAYSNNEWQRIGPVLVNSVTRSLEVTEERAVPISNRFRLVEEEEETSFIDLVALRVSRGGVSLDLKPRGDGRIVAEDGDYLVLRKGQHVELKFDLPKSFRGGSFQVVVKGFYVPDSLVAGAGRMKRGDKTQ